MGEITTFLGVQSIISLPILYMTSVYTDWLRTRYYTPYVRKLMYMGPLAVIVIGNYNTIIYGMYCTILGFCAYALLPCNKWMVYMTVVCITLSNGITLTNSCKPVPNELGGKFAAEVYAFTNTVGSVGAILG